MASTTMPAAVPASSAVAPGSLPRRISPATRADRAVCTARSAKSVSAPVACSNVQTPPRSARATIRATRRLVWRRTGDTRSGARPSQAARSCAKQTSGDSCRAGRSQSASRSIRSRRNGLHPAVAARSPASPGPSSAKTEAVSVAASGSCARGRRVIRRSKVMRPLSRRGRAGSTCRKARLAAQAGLRAPSRPEPGG